MYSPLTNSIGSLVTWNDAINNGFTGMTIGLTGIDNGLVTFNKLSGDTNNDALLSALTGTTLVINTGDTRLHLTEVTGMTGNYIYPLSIIPNTGGTSGQYVNFCGGFYQGYYKLDNDEYQVLPNRYEKGFTSEVWLRPKDVCSGVTGTTLNAVNPNNSGFFLYFGTRAENKFANSFSGNNSGNTCTTGSTEWCTPIKESDISILDIKSGINIPLSTPPVNVSRPTPPVM